MIRATDALDKPDAQLTAKQREQVQAMVDAVAEAVETKMSYLGVQITAKEADTFAVSAFCHAARRAGWDVQLTPQTRDGLLRNQKVVYAYQINLVPTAEARDAYETRDGGASA